MNRFFITASTLLLMSQAAFAHVEIGTYSGKTASGEVCSIETLRMYFEGGVHHPLNERVVVRYGTEEFTIAHPAVVDAARQTAHFNHDVLQAVTPTPKGARAFVLDMVHEEGHEGPRTFHLIDHQWRTGTRTSVDCVGLELKRP